MQGERVSRTTETLVNPQLIPEIKQTQQCGRNSPCTWFNEIQTSILVWTHTHCWVGHLGAVRPAKRSKFTYPQLKGIWFTADSKCKTEPEAQTPGNTQTTLGRCWELTTVHHCVETPLWVYRMPFSLLFTPSHPAPFAPALGMKMGVGGQKTKRDEV